MTSLISTQLNPQTERHFSPIHGGNIAQASACYGIPEAQWLDLSTGINPDAYPVDTLSHRAFQQIPYLSTAFLDAASHYYQQAHLIPTNGTQQVIERLPALLSKLPVLLPELGYQEHEQAWARNGNDLTHYPAFHLKASQEIIEHALTQNSARHLVIINPNNPTGLLFPATILHKWACQLTSGGKLIIDEAFIDAQPDQSVLGDHFHPNMIVLRSFGKFFGLAGLRLGFCFAGQDFLARLRQTIGLWEINGPAQAIATRAFQDKTWISRAISSSINTIQARQRLLDPLFAPLHVQWKTHQAYFSTYLLHKVEAEGIYQHFAQQGILFRYISFSNTQSLIRVGQFDQKDEQSRLRIQQAANTFHRLFPAPERGAIDSKPTATGSTHQTDRKTT